jgi:hypothetical protein
VDEVVAVLPVVPWTLAALATVLIVALGVPPGGPRPATVRSPPSPVAGRTGAAVALAAAAAVVVVCRVGPASELRNPAPALVVGLGWPLLFLLPALVGLVRRRPDDAPDPAREDVRPAAAAALAVVGFLTLPVASTTPYAVGTAVAGYALIMITACIALGRRLVAARFELLGLLVRWLALGRALPRWAAPRGALAVLAVLLGGAWFERYERTTAWTVGLPGRGTTLAGLAVALGLAATGAGALHLATRRGGAPGTAAAVLLPLAAAVTVAGVSRRAMISAQLLADQAAGPRTVDPDPLGLLGGQALALGLVVLGAALGATVLARRMGQETARLPGVGVLLLLTGASAWLVLQP